jgi:hypothetical protein
MGILVFVRKLNFFPGSEILTIRSNHPAFLPPEVISQLLASGHQTATEQTGIF